MSSDARHTTVVVNPTSGAGTTAGLARTVLDGLAGRTVALFSNNKPNAAALLDRVGSRLAETFGIAVRCYAKAVPSLGAEADLLDAMARECDAVVIAGFD